MVEALLRKLEHYVGLTPHDKTTIRDAFSDRVLTLEARSDLICEGEPPHCVHLIISGWACRYKQLEDGRKQILSLSLPGDLCDLNIHLLDSMDHSIGSITAISYATIAHDRLARLIQSSARIDAVLQIDSLVNMATQREWTVNLGQRRAMERLAHLFCEIFLRLKAIGHVSAQVCDMPLTQVDLANATGLSVVHVNRALQELRQTGCVDLHGRHLTLKNFAQLRELALFDDNYLHLKRGE